MLFSLLWLILMNSAYGHCCRNDISTRLLEDMLIMRRLALNISRNDRVI